MEKEKKGKGLLKNQLEYEGEFLFERKYNGKGYDKNNKIIYELINGNGKVKEYSYDNKLIFEGEYKNGDMDKKGKEYNINGRLIFDGEYLNRRKWNGKIYDNNNSIYELKNGKGYIK